MVNFVKNISMYECMGLKKLRGSWETIPEYRLIVW